MKTGGFEYYEYISCYVDDVLCISHNLHKLMNRIQEYFKLKYNKIEPCDIYIGATLAKMNFESGNSCCTMSSEKYVKAAVANLEDNLARSGKIFLSKCVTPLLINYAHWLEDSPELMANIMQRCQELIGQIIWFVEIRCMDILLEISLLLIYLAMPRVGHLDQAFLIFEYFKAHPKRKLVFDPAHPSINKNRFQQFD